MVLLLLWLLLIYSSINIGTHRLLYVGDICTIEKTGENGICTIIHDCSSAKEGLRNKERPQHCGFDGFNPIVCCTDGKRGQKLITRGRKVGDISLQKCMEYSKLIYPTKENSKCPLVNNDAEYRIVQPKEFPHTVLVGLYHILGNNWGCHGVLISENYVLMTTDCLDGVSDVARFGANFSSTNKFGGNVQLRNITEWTPFPEYLARNKNNNIALAKLASPVELNEFVHPACVHADSNLGTKFFASDGDYFYEPADGNNTDDKTETRDVTKVTLETIPYENCTAKFKPLSKTRERYICAALTSTSREDQCSPKGPLLKLHPTAFCMQTVVGLDAYSILGCDGMIRPHAYTNVFNYIEWIERHVWNEEGKS